MKKIGKLSVLLLVLAMAFSFAACGMHSESAKGDQASNVIEEEKPENTEGKAELTDEELLLGTWRCRFDVSNSIGAALFGTDEDITVSPIYADIMLEFKDDRTYITTMELDRDSFESYIQDIADDMVELMYKRSEDEGVSREDFAAQIQTEQGMSVEAYVDSELVKYMDATIDAMTTESDTAYYKVDSEGGRICITDAQEALDDTQAYMEYAFTENKLIIKKLVNNNGEEVYTGAMGMGLPWNFEQKSY